MRLKSYFVHTMEEALQAAKVELGDEAMLVDSKRLQAPADGRPRLEVIFASPVAPPPVPPPRVELPAATAAVTPAADLRRFRGELTTLLDALNHQPCAVRLGSLSPAGQQLDNVRARLLTSEVPVPAIEEALALLRPTLERLVLTGQATEDAVLRTAMPLLAAEWAPAPPVRTQGPRTISLVGPTGAGKTSAIAKLAFHLGVLTGRTVSVFSVDNLRIGASDQLAHLCSLLGVRFEAVEHTATLAARVSAHQHQNVILIDTPGYGAADTDIAAETAASLRRIESLECHLTLPATLRYREMQRRREQFSAFSPSHLLFTRLDETEYFGPAWALARDSRLPVEWVSTGPGIPEDLAGSDALRVASAILSLAPYSAELKLSQNLTSAAKAGASRI